MIARRCKGLCAAVTVATAFLAGCSSATTSVDNSAASASASAKSAVCASVGQLKDDVAGLKNINVRASGLSGVSAELTKIQQQLGVVKSNAHGQFSPQITDLSNALSGLKSSLTAAKDNLNGGTLTAVASASGSVVTAGNNLVSAVSHTC